MHCKLVAFERDTSVPTLSNDELRAILHPFSQMKDDIARRRNPITQRQAGFRTVDADIVGARIPRNEVVPHIRAVALGIDRQKSRRRDQVLDDLGSNQSMTEISGYNDVRRRTEFSDVRFQLLLKVDR